MKKIKKKYWVGIVSLVAVSALVAVLVMTFAGAQEEADYSGFAKCLTDNGLVFYGTDWCGHCQDQKEMFGKDIDLIDFVNCDFEGEIRLLFHRTYRKISDKQ